MSPISKVAKLASVAVALLALAACSGTGADDNLAGDTQDQKAGASLPLREISGLAGHDGRFVAVGDRSSTVVTFELRGGELHHVEEHKPLPKAGKNGSQYEAVAFDGAGNVVILSEQGEVVVLSDDLEKEVSTSELDWDSASDVLGLKLDKNSLGEGMVILGKGHLLVALEKGPSAIVEFGPKGDEPFGYDPGARPAGAFKPADKLVALKSWTVEDSAAPDLSELTVGPDGALWALSQQGRNIVRFERLLKPDEGRATVKEHVSLPGDIVGAEGLVFDGARPIVARDRSSDSGKNLFILAPVE